MAKLRDNIEQNLPFVSVINYGDNEYVGIIINQDQYVTSFYDLNAIKTPNETKLFLEIGEMPANDFDLDDPWQRFSDSEFGEGATIVLKKKDFGVSCNFSCNCFIFIYFL